MKFLNVYLFTILLSGLAIFSAQGEGEAQRSLISPNDVVEIKVFREEELDSKLRVSRDGIIVFPLVGTVKIAGRSPEDAARTIRDLLAKDYLVNPQVSLTVTEYNRRRFSVLGQVQKPGAYDMPDRESLTLLEAIAMAGGYTRIADPAKITLKRAQGDSQSVLKLNAKEMAKDNRITTFAVQPGDVISVGESLF